jgi:ribosomal protein S5
LLNTEANCVVGCLGSVEVYCNSFDYGSGILLNTEANCVVSCLGSVEVYCNSFDYGSGILLNTEANCVVGCLGSVEVYCNSFDYSFTQCLEISSVSLQYSTETACSVVLEYFLKLKTFVNRVHA